ncbi:uncharacterized protein LOC131154296 [Malania oleifera]|uniref:uncharacterized protein LOC131154296 n=1 Tax=Malania oleifera TaxID=397392 RepID=UPI0025AE3AF5|nr:uncharacterized protein LOC131154296 [Malania oleifera]
MACFVPVCFSLPVGASETLTEEMHVRRSHLEMFSSQATAGTGAWQLLSPRSLTVRIASAAIKLNPSSLSRSTFSANWSCCHHSMAPSRHLYGLVSCCFNVSNGTNIVIYGYWVGPDFEDGWGFVEAFVNQIL